MGIILNRNTLGKHYYKHYQSSTNVLKISLRFKGKTTVNIIGVYGPAGNTNEHTKDLDSILRTIKKHINPTHNQFYIVGGDFNEDPDQSRTTKIIDALYYKGLVKANANHNGHIHTWNNPRGENRALDHIFSSGELLTDVSSNLIISPNFPTDHLAVVVVFKANTIIFNRKHRTPRNKNSNQLDTKHIDPEEWENFKEATEIPEEIKKTLLTSQNINQIYEDLEQIIITAAKDTLRWVEES